MTALRNRYTTPAMADADRLKTLIHQKCVLHGDFVLASGARSSVYFDCKRATLDPEGDIEDPIGGDLALYQEVAGQLRMLIEKRLAEKALP